MIRCKGAIVGAIPGVGTDFWGVVCLDPCGVMTPFGVDFLLALLLLGGNAPSVVPSAFADGTLGCLASVDPPLVLGA